MRVKNFKKTFNTFFRAGIKIILLFLLVSGAGVRGFAADRIMLFSPHEDDETIACAGIINRAVERGDEIFVVMVLNGDSHGGVIKAQIRIERTIAAMEVLGLSKDHILYLGYADGRVLGNAWQNPGEIFTSSDGITIETYGFPEDQYPHIGIEDYHYTTYGEHALYTRENISTDFTNLLNEYQPDVIFSPAPIEVHADHSSVGLFLTEALVQIGTNPANTYTPLVYEYLIYKQRLPQDTQDPTEPVLNTEANMDATPYAWLNRVSYAVPEEMTLPFESNL
ncbi:MAG: PIG-L family deacetylase, partial [bacterium]|nr:PIG-L family deacetylase [bacterium]